MNQRTLTKTFGLLDTRQIIECYKVDSELTSNQDEQTKQQHRDPILVTSAFKESLGETSQDQSRPVKTSRDQSRPKLALILVRKRARKRPKNHALTSPKGS